MQGDGPSNYKKKKWKLIAYIVGRCHFCWLSYW